MAPPFDSFNNFIALSHSNDLSFLSFVQLLGDRFWYGGDGRVYFTHPWSSHGSPLPPVSLAAESRYGKIPLLQDLLDSGYFEKTVRHYL